MLPRWYCLYANLPECLRRGKKPKGASNFFDAPPGSYRIMRAILTYCNGATVAAQAAMPPLGTKRTTASSIEQKDRTPVWVLDGLACVV